MATEEIQSATNAWDAIKAIGTIGFPMLATYWITSSNNEKEIKRLEQQHENELTKLEKEYEHDTNKNKLDIKIKILEESIELIQQYILILDRLMYMWYNFSKVESPFYYKEINDQKITFTEKEYLSLHRENINNIELVTKGTSRLQMINAENINTPIVKIYEDFTNLSNSFINNQKQFLQAEEFSVFQQKYNSLKRNFNHEVSKYFKQLN